MFSKSDPSDCRTHSSCARYWSRPLTRMPSAVRSRIAAPRRQLRRRQNGSRAFGGCCSLGRMEILRSLVHRELRYVTLEEELHRPVEDDAQARGPGGELQHV